MRHKLNNKLVGQVGEHLLSAKLGMKGYYASPYAGNVPAFDITAVNAETLESFVIQVKTSTTNTLLQSDIDKWIETDIDETGLYSFGRLKELTNPDMIWVAVNLNDDNLHETRYFLCREYEIQKAIVERFVTWIKGHNYRRPKGGKSTQAILKIEDMLPFEDNWAILDR